MAKNGFVAALLVALVAAATVAEAAERSGDTRCMAECYFECKQIEIFSDDECKKDCIFACDRYAIGKNMRELDDNKFFPSWI